VDSIRQPILGEIYSDASFPQNKLQSSTKKQTSRIVATKTEQTILHQSNVFFIDKKKKKKSNTSRSSFTLAPPRPIMQPIWLW
jgi:hypothetical protein